MTWNIKRELIPLGIIAGAIALIAFVLIGYSPFASSEPKPPTWLELKDQKVIDNREYKEKRVTLH